MATLSDFAIEALAFVGAGIAGTGRAVSGAYRNWKHRLAMTAVYSAIGGVLISGYTTVKSDVTNTETASKNGAKSPINFVANEVSGLNQGFNSVVNPNDHWYIRWPLKVPKAGVLLVAAPYLGASAFGAGLSGAGTGMVINEGHRVINNIGDEIKNKWNSYHQSPPPTPPQPPQGKKTKRSGATPANNTSPTAVRPVVVPPKPIPPDAIPY